MLGISMHSPAIVTILIDRDIFYPSSILVDDDMIRSYNEFKSIVTPDTKVLFVEGIDMLKKMIDKNLDLSPFKLLIFDSIRNLESFGKINIIDAAKGNEGNPVWSIIKMNADILNSLIAKDSFGCEFTSSDFDEYLGKQTPVKPDGRRGRKPKNVNAPEDNSSESEEEMEEDMNLILMDNILNEKKEESSESDATPPIIIRKNPVVEIKEDEGIEIPDILKGLTSKPIDIPETIEPVKTEKPKQEEVKETKPKVEPIKEEVKETRWIPKAEALSGLLTSYLDSIKDVDSEVYEKVKYGVLEYAFGIKPRRQYLMIKKTLSSRNIPSEGFFKIVDLLDTKFHDKMYDIMYRYYIYHENTLENLCKEREYDINEIYFVIDSLEVKDDEKPEFVWGDSTKFPKTE